MPLEQPIAIVGVSALFPGSLDNQGFWRDILAGKDLIDEVPPTHWLLEDYHHPEGGKDKTYARRGAFLSDVEFAPMDYGVPPNILAATDTGQLLAMIVARQLLEDTYDAPFEQVDTSRIGVVLGVASTTELCLHMAGRLQQPVWEEGLRRSGLTPEEVDQISEKITEMYVPWQENTFPGLLGNVVSGRIANRFDLGGTNCVVDAACASSLAALEMGANQLSLGQADMMITGGVDALNDILMYMCFSQTGALSQSGDCRPFSSLADGTMMAEGLGMFALKRLEDAEEAGDQIYAVVRGIGSSSDGRAKSIYAPRPEGQSKALERAYDDAGYDPKTVEMVEAHGTATPAGDAAEMRGLKTVFGQQDDRPWCALGSVKSQIGHAKAAAGAAGLFKTVMSLNHRVLPPTIKVEEPNPDLELDESPFYVNTEPRPWIRPSDHPRRNAVSAFGFGGTNFHITLEEYRGEGREAPRRRTLDAELVVLSADEPQQLVDRCGELVDEIEAFDEEHESLLAFFAKTTQQQFDVDQPVRLAVVGSDDADLVSKLKQAAKSVGASPKKSFESPNGIHYGFDEEPGDVAFLFPGQGSQYLNMGAGWAMHFDEARQVWDAAADLPLDDDWRLDEVVYPQPVFDEESRDEQRDRLTATEWAQPALGATSLSALRLFEKLGVNPACAGGHSYGEVTALCAAGVFDEEAMLKISRKRGELMAAASSTPGSMVAVQAQAEQLEELLDQWGIDVVIANHNSPQQCVLSGATSAIEEVEEKLEEESLKFTRLDVATAFHSSLVSDSAEPFKDFLAALEFGDAEFPVYANTTADAYPNDADEMRTLLGEQLANPVRFVEQIRAMYDAGARTFVEVGPRGTLTKLVGKCLGDCSHHRVNIDRRGKHGVQTLFDAVGQLAVYGVDVDFSALWDGYEEIDDPRQKEDAGFTVAINGTNYGKPYPGDDPRPEPDERPLPPGGFGDDASVERQPEPKPERPSVSTTDSQGSTTMSSNDETTQSPPAPSQQTGQPQKSQPAWQQTADDAGASWVEAFREQQRQTAEAHRTFQETTAEAHRAFLQTMDSSFRAIGQIVTGEPSEATPPQPPALQPPKRQPQRGPQQTDGGRRTEEPPAVQPEATRPAEGPGAVDPVVAGQQASQRQPEPARAQAGAGAGQQIDSSGYQPGPPPASARQQQPTNGGIPSEPARPAKQSEPSTPPQQETLEPKESTDDVNVLDLLLSTVADKTGYPSEMLEPGMELEADLGVDSIKQVEIMSEMEEQIPQLPEVEANELADLRTLTSIADYLGGLLGGSQDGGGSAADDAQQPADGADVPAADAPDVGGVLLEVVAEKTGYPAEMLEPGMELEADLGVDSIKQVEIMSEMEERFPQLPEVEANELAELNTLDEIATYLDGLMGGRESRTPSSSSQDQDRGSDEDSEEDCGSDGIARYPVRPVESPGCGWAMPGLFDVDIVHVVGSDTEVADALVEQFEQRGVDAVSVDEAPSDAEAVVQIDGLCSMESLEEATAINRKVILGARDLVADGDPPRIFVTVQNTGGQFRSADGSVQRAWLAGVGALAKTAASEWPDCAVKAIDLDAGGLSADEQAEAIADELFAGGPELEVGLGADGRRVSPVAFTESVEVGDATGPLEEGDVVVVSGGAKGVTARSIIELADEISLKFVLLGRTELAEEPEVCRGVEGDAELKRVLLEEAKQTGEMPTPKQLQSKVKHILSCREIRDTISKLEAAGAEARYGSADVRDREAIEAILDDLRDEWGEVDGLIHGAGVLADALIADKTADQFDFVFKTKIEGLKALLDATGDDPLKVICMFSSVAARSGNPGQSDYAMANEVLNKVAHAEAHRRDNCLVKSLGWGPWDGGMVTPELKKHFEAEGVVLLPKDRGARMLVEELVYAPADDIELVLGGSVSAEGINGSQIGRGVAAEFVVDAETHPYLDSHRLRGTAVVPAMLVVEWFTRFAHGCCPHRRLRRLRDLEVRKGIQAENYDDAGDRLTIRADVDDDNSTGDEPVLQLKLTGDDGTVHYAAVAEMGAHFDAADDELVAGYDFDVPESPFEMDEIYVDGRLFHGADFEVLTDIEGIGEGGGIASLEGLLRMDWPDEGWQTDPAAMDGALQIGLLWGLDLIGDQTLPMRVDEFRPFVGAPSDQPLVCRVRRADHSSRKIVADVLIETAGGEVLCELRGVSMFAVPDGV